MEDAPNNFRFFLLWLCFALKVDSCNRVLSSVLCRFCLPFCIVRCDELRATDAGMVSLNPYNPPTKSDNQIERLFLRKFGVNELGK